VKVVTTALIPVIIGNQVCQQLLQVGICPLHSIFCGALGMFVAEVRVVVKVIGATVSAPKFTQPQYSVTIPESTTRFTNVLNVTAESDPTGNCCCE